MTTPTIQRPGLGRLKNHDPASRAYSVGAGKVVAVISRDWERRVGIFDQGQVGSCTGNAAAGWLGTDNSTGEGLLKLADGTAVNEKLATLIYSDAEDIDGDGPYPPNDNGSSGLSVAKVLKNRGLITGYLHAFSAADLCAALQTGPGMLGIVWYNSMFDTDSTGHIKVDKSSGEAGGHEIVVPRLDVTNKGVVERVWIDNSWGISWGISGSGYFTLAELTALLKADGDFTQPQPIVIPAPSPSPSPQPAPVPVPSPVVDPLSFLDQTVASHIKAVAKADVSGWMNHHFQTYFHIKL